MKPWTQAELDYIPPRWRTQSDATIATIINAKFHTDRTAEAVGTARRRHLKLFRGRWTFDENAAITDNPNLTAAQIADLINNKFETNRTIKAVEQQRHRLKVALDKSVNV